MCIRCKTGEWLGEPRLYPCFKPHTHKIYILRHCTTIVYITKDDPPEYITFIFTLEYMVRLIIADKT